MESCGGGDPEIQADEFNPRPRNSPMRGNRAVTTGDSVWGREVGKSDGRRQLGGLEGVSGEVVGSCTRKQRREIPCRFLLSQ